MPLANELVHGFDSNSLDTALFSTSGTQLVFQNKRLEIPLLSSTSGSSFLVTKISHDLTNNSSFVKMSGYREGATSAEAEFFLTQQTGQNNGFSWLIGNGSILANRFANGTRTTIFSASWHPGNDAFCRVRNSGTTVFFDTAPVTSSNPPIEANWINRGSVTVTAAELTTLFQRLRGGAFDATSVNPGTAIFDAWNTVNDSTVNFQEIQYVGVTTTTATTGTTSTAVPYPSGVLAGDRLLLSVASKYAATIATPAGWTLLATHQGGITTAGVDSGSPRQTIFWRDAAAGEPTSVTVTKATETGTVLMGSILAFRRQTGSVWAALTSSKGADTTGATDWSVTGDVALDAREGDLFVANNAMNSDISTATNQILSIGSTTFGSMVEEKEIGTATGDDLRQNISLHYATSGSGNAAPVYTFTAENKTLANAPAGPTIIVRLRADPGAALRSFTFALDPGNIAIAGNNPNLRVSRRLTLAPGAIPVAGNNPNLRVSRRLALAPGNVGFAGNDATLRASRKLIAAPGAIAFAGQPSNLRISRRLVAAPGEIAVNGNAANLRVSRKLVAATGTIPLAGNAATLRVSRRLALAPGNVPVAGGNVTLRYGRKFALEPGNVAVIGYAATLRAGRKIALETGSIPVSGNEITFRGPPIKFSFLPGNIGVAGGDVTLRVSRRFTAAPGAIAVNGSPATLRVARRLSLAPGSIPVVGSAAVLRYARKFLLDSGAIAFDGRAAVLRVSRRLPASPGAIAVNGGNVTLRVGRRLLAAPGAIPVAGDPVSLRVERNFYIDRGIIPVDGGEVEIRKQTLEKILSISTGNIAVNGGDLLFRVARRFALEPGVIAVSGPPVSLRVSRRLTAAGGAIAVAGGNVSLRVSRRFLASPGAIEIGGEVRLAVERFLRLESGAISLDMRDADLIRRRVFRLEPGVVDFSGNDVSIVYKKSNMRFFRLDPGAVGVDGRDIGFYKTIRFVDPEVSFSNVDADASAFLIDPETMSSIVEAGGDLFFVEAAPSEFIIDAQTFMR